MFMVYWLVVLTNLKNMKVNGKDYIPYMKWKNKKCSKPPTKHVSQIVFTTEHIKHIAKPCKNLWLFVCNLRLYHRYTPENTCAIQSIGTKPYHFSMAICALEIELLTPNPGHATTPKWELPKYPLVI